MNDLLTCVDCGKLFDFPEWEKQKFLLRGWPAPKRCKEHRAVKAKKWDKIRGEDAMRRLQNGEKITIG